MQGMYPDGIMWVHCGPAATAWSVLRQLWQIVRRVRLTSGSQPVQWLNNPGQCASKPRPSLSLPSPST